MKVGMGGVMMGQGRTSYHRDLSGNPLFQSISIPVKLAGSKGCGHAAMRVKIKQVDLSYMASYNTIIMLNNGENWRNLCEIFIYEMRWYGKIRRNKF